MAEALPLSEGELRLLRALVSHRVRFMVVGLSAAALQGAPVVTQDVDLWFEDLHDPRLVKALRQVGAAYVPPFGHNPPMLAGRHTEPFDVVLRMSGLEDFKLEYKRAEKINVAGFILRVLSLERILASKTAANRDKDRLVLPVLQAALRTVSITRTSRRPGKATRRKRRK